MPKQVLMSAFIGSKNLGDEAIFESLLANIDFRDSAITAVSVDPLKTKQQNGIDAIPAKNALKLFSAIKDADIVIMGGGGIIQDQSSLLNMLYYGYQLCVAKVTKTPVVLAFVGVGPVKHWISKWLLAYASSTITLAIVRDEKSKRALQSICPNLSVDVYHDPVLSYPVPAMIRPLQAKAANTVVVSLRQWYFSVPLLPASLARKLNARGLRSQKYLALTKGLASNLDKYLDEHEGHQLQFVSFYDSEDQQMTHDVLQHMKNKDRCQEPQQNLTTVEYMEIVESARFVFGIRLHSLILASARSKAFVAIDYSPKVGSFAKSMMQEDVTVSIDEYGNNSFSKAMNDVSNTYEIRQKTIKSIHENMLLKNKEAFTQIAKQISGE